MSSPTPASSDVEEKVKQLLGSEEVRRSIRKLKKMGIRVSLQYLGVKDGEERVALFLPINDVANAINKYITYPRKRVRVMARDEVGFIVVELWRPAVK